MGMFDDLVPDAKKAGPKPVAFDDLIPSDPTRMPGVIGGAFGNQVMRTAGMARPVARMTDADRTELGLAPEHRSLGEVVTDSATGLRQGARNVTSGVLGLPVNIVNTLTRRALPTALGAINPGLVPLIHGSTGRAVNDVVTAGMMVSQPEVVQGMRDEIRAANEADNESYSPAAQAFNRKLQRTPGYADTLGLLASNPGVALSTVGAQQVPQLAMAIVPGSTLGTIGLQSLQAGAQSEDQVSADLREAGALPVQIAQAGADSFLLSALINGGMAKAIRGGDAVERMLAGDLGRAGASTLGGRARQAVTSIAGETISNTAEEGLDQAQQNYFTGKPIGQDVGQNAALGTVFGLGTGALAGGTHALAGVGRHSALGDTASGNTIDPALLAAGNAALRADVQPAPQQPDVRPAARATTEQIDSLLLRNVLGDAEKPSVPWSDAEVALGLVPEARQNPFAAPDGVNPAAFLDAAKLALQGLDAKPEAQAGPVAPPAVVAPEAKPAPARAPEPPSVSAPVDETGAPEWRREYRPSGRKDSKGRDIIEPVVDLGRDGLLQWLGAHGGVDFESVRSQAGADPDLMNDPAVARPFGRVGWPAMRRSGGMSLETLVEKMRDSGWLPRQDQNRPPQHDVNDALSLVMDAINGRPVHHPEIGHDERAMRQAQQRAEDEAHLDGQLAADLGFSDASAMYNAIDQVDQRVAQREGAAFGADTYGEARGFNELFRDPAVLALPESDFGRIIDLPSTSEQARALWDVISRSGNYGTDRRAAGGGGEGRNQASGGGARETARGGQPDGRAADQAGPGVSGAPPGPAGRAGAASERGGPNDGGQRRVAESRPDGLFGAPTARDHVDAAQRAKDAQRDGKTGAGRTDMLAGDGELFAGDRPVQARVDDIQATVNGEVGLEELTADERRAFDEAQGRQSSERQKVAIAERSRMDGDADADALGLREAVQKAVGGSKVESMFMRNMGGLHGLVKPSVLDSYLENVREGKRRIAGVYVTADKSASGKPFFVLFTNEVRNPHLAAFTAGHELAGHHGLRTLLGADLDKMMELAWQNPTVRAVAESTMRQRKWGPDLRLRAVEEALSDLSAAVRMDNFDTIAERHGVVVPEGMRERIKTAIDNLVKRIKMLLQRRGMEFSDQEVRQLIEASWQAAEGGDAGRLPAGKADVFNESVLPETRAAYEARIDALFDGAAASPHGVTVLDEGDVLSVAGFGSLPVVLAEKHAVDDGRYNHGLTREQWKQLPVWLDSPVAMFERASDGHITLIAPEKIGGRGVVIGLQPKATPGRSAAPRHLVLTAYAKDQGTLNLRAAVNRGDYAPLYVDQKKNSPKFYEDSGISYPGSAVDLRALNRRLKTERDLVKYRAERDSAGDAILESVIYTPEQQRFMEQAGLASAPDSRTTWQRMKESAAGRIPAEWKARFLQVTVDQYYGLKRESERAGLTDENSPYMAARLINIGSTMEAVLRFGAPKLVDGTLRVDRGVKGLMDALEPVKDRMPQFLGWMVARRAQLLKAQGRENLMSDADIRAGLSLRNGNEAEFDQAALDYLKLKNAILDLAEKTGIIDPVARAAWDHAEYIPFYREGDSGGAGTRRGIANQTSGIRTLKGGEQALRDPLSNIIQNFTRLVDSSMKNRAAMLAVDKLGPDLFDKAVMEMKAETIPLDQVKKHLLANGVDAATIAGMPASAIRGVSRMLSIKAPEGDDVIRVMRGGKPEYYHVRDPFLLTSLTALHESPTPLWLKFLQWPKHLLTFGATATPDFAVANMLRDTGEAAVTSKDRFIPVWDTLRGAVDSFRHDELTQDLMMAGASFHGGYFRQGDQEATADAIRRALQKGGKSKSFIDAYVKTLVTPSGLKDLYFDMLGATEQGSRVSLARRRLDAGGTFTEAAFEAKDLLDFQLRGSAPFVRFFTQVIPFLNARLQGMYRLGRLGTARERRNAVAAKLAVMAVMSSALYATNLMLFGAGYDDLEDWDKDANWHIMPGTKRHIRIPKPFELGLLGGTLPERMYSAARYQLGFEENADRPGQTMDSVIHDVTGTLALNPVPQAAKPVVEQWANRDMFFDRPIESQSDKYKAASKRYGNNTSDTLRLASKGMAAVVGEDMTLSPKRMEHLWRGYTAGMGMYALKVSDWMVRKASDAPERPDMTLRDFPVIGRFVRGTEEPYSTRFQGEFYDLKDKADAKSAEIKGMIENGEQDRAEKVEREYAWLLGDREDAKRAKGGFMHSGVRVLGRAGRDLAALRKEDTAIYEDRDMTGAEKRKALDANAKKRNEMTREIVKELRKAERKT